MLLHAHTQDPTTFTYQDVHDEMTTFLFATFENYVVLSNALYMMSTHTETQDRLRAEAMSVLYPSSGGKGKEGEEGEVFYSYLNMCI
jgi:cytochrome P450